MDDLVVDKLKSYLEPKKIYILEIENKEKSHADLYTFIDLKELAKNLTEYFSDGSEFDVWADHVDFNAPLYFYDQKEFFDCITGEEVFGFISFYQNENDGSNKKMWVNVFESSINHKIQDF